MKWRMFAWKIIRTAEVLRPNIEVTFKGIWLKTKISNLLFYIISVVYLLCKVCKCSHKATENFLEVYHLLSKNGYV